MDPDVEILRGTLDLLILRALNFGPAHGVGVARWIERATSDVLRIGEGSLYPALHRLEERELVQADWGVSENNRKAKYYSLTRRGRHHLTSSQAKWTRFARAVFAALEAPAQPA